MGETLKSWIDEYESGRTKDLPMWIRTEDLKLWGEFVHSHPEVAERIARERELTQKLAKDPNSIETMFDYGVKNVNRALEKMDLSVTKALNGIRSASIRNGNLVFTALFHHLINRQLLKTAFSHLRKSAAPGIDRVTWDEYQRDLDSNINKLWERLISWRYYPQPVRRTYIPKASGGMRPLGICAIEDKIVQYALKMILENIYEPRFLGLSYGFRPGTRAHDALDAVYVAITEKNVNYVLDADIVGCFDNINQEILLEILKDSIGDKRVLKLIGRLLRAGVLDKGELRTVDNGVVQGSPLSPLLANVFLDYVLDKFIVWWRKTFAKGEVYYVRYADDYIICFQYKEDAEDLLKVLADRLLCAGLRLNDKKTRLIEFGKNARSHIDSEQKANLETFNFLGFTHKCGLTRSGRTFKLVRHCISERVTKKLLDFKNKLYKLRFPSLKDMIAWINSVLKGYYAYFAVPDNLEPLSSFRHALMKIVYKRLHRFSQRCKWTWEKFNRHLSSKFVIPRRCHDYPNRRMAGRQKTLHLLRFTIERE